MDRVHALFSVIFRGRGSGGRILLFTDKICRFVRFCSGCNSRRSFVVLVFATGAAWPWCSTRCLSLASLERVCVFPSHV